MMNEKKAANNIDIILPFGENLLPLIAPTSSLSDNDLKIFLAKKGIYISSKDREKTIPLLANSLLSPIEFEILRDNYKDKESIPKRRNRVLTWNTDLDLRQALKKFTFPKNEIISKNQEYYYRFVNISPFKPVESNKNHLIAEYSIQRTDRTKDWASQNSFHKGTIELELTPDLKNLKVAMGHTVDETHSVNESSLRTIKNYLLENDYIKNETDKKITFGEFSNKSRVKFLLNLLDNNLDISNTFNFIELTNVEITIDEDKILPDQIKWMESKVSSIKFSGKSLHETDLLKDPQFHDSIILSSVKATYEFQSIVSTGSCTFDFGFYARGNNIPNNTEFVYRLTSFKFESDTKTKNKVQSYLYAKFDEFKSNAYKKTIE